MVDPLGGRSYVGSGRGHELQASASIFFYGDSCGRYVFLNISLFSKFIKEKIYVFAYLFLNFVNGCMIMQMTLCLVIPTMSIIRGQMFLVGEMLHPGLWP